MKNSEPPVGRLAPSPTGLLHLGNAWAFLWAWLAAKVEDGRVILRMEDLDPARSRREWAEAIREDLLWLGLDWDVESEGQSQCESVYQQALSRLESMGLIYPCFCTRKELREMAGAPQVGDSGAHYPGTCKYLSPEQKAEKSRQGCRYTWRLACPERVIHFEDAIQGPQALSLAQCGGDFALRRSDGVWAYQLAVVADDARLGVTQVVRGEDILCSTPRQILLYQLLGGEAPAYAHLPLLHDEQGERLAKRHQSLSLRALRESGVEPGRIIAFLAALAGFAGEGENLSPIELKARIQREHASFPWEHLRISHKIQIRPPSLLIPVWGW